MIKPIALSLKAVASRVTVFAQVSRFCKTSSTTNYFHSSIKPSLIYHSNHKRSLFNIFSRRTYSMNTMAAQQVNDDENCLESAYEKVRGQNKPIHYDVELEPSFTDFTFKGRVAIKFKNTPDLHEILINANELVIHSGSLLAEYDSAKNIVETRPLLSVFYGKKSQLVKLTFDKKNAASSEEQTMELTFTGILNDKMRGFYRTSWSSDPTYPYAVTTQFEATDARRCFPCWDEPAMKATFGVSVTFQNPEKVNYIALSNMPIEFKDDSTDLKTYKFRATPIMSTYLLALCIGPFERITIGKSADTVCEVNVYTMPGKKEQGRFALDVAMKSLQYYETYFQIRYPLPKMDLVAIPDFAAGAMENWGLVTYRETCLLVDSENTSTDRKQYVALVVAHEIAHQWFGNLVTMQWWTHLWLNEGFASFMEFLCVDHIFPDYDIWSQFVTDSYVRALDLDSLHNSHPIEVPVKHPSEIDSIFDDISYSKGASVIRMLYNYIGDDAFRSGMKEYLNHFRYSNAKTEDLWKFLGDASNKPVQQIMSGWTSQQGFPWISIKSEPVGNSLKLTLTQAIFTADGKAPANDAETLWMIPVSVTAGNNPDKISTQILMDKKEAVITIENVGENWIKFNPGTISLFRTAYPPELAKRFGKAIQDKTLPAMDRLGLQNDLFALCLAGKVCTTGLLELMSSFKGENNYTVWNSIDASIGKINILLSYTDSLEKFQKFARGLYSEIFQKVGWDPKEKEPHTVSMTRALVVNRLIALGDLSVIDEAIKRYKAQMADSKNSIVADLRSPIYRAVSTHGDEQIFESLFQIYRTAELHEEKNRAARALGFAKDESRLKKALDFAISNEVRNQDRVFIIMPVGVTNQEYAFEFLKANKDFFRTTYRGFLMSRIIKYSTENFASEAKAVEVTKFFEENDFRGYERIVEQSIETIRLNSDWLVRDGTSIKEFLSGQIK